MQKLLDAISALVCQVSPERVQAIANRIRQANRANAEIALAGATGTPAAAAVSAHLIESWRATAVSAEELANMLLAAGNVFTRTCGEQSVELVWTGPTTPFVSARRTEQALLQVINSAVRSIFITSFVAYDVSTIVKALNEATARGVAISMLLELSQEHGGNISFDAISKLKILVPSAKLFAWRDKAEQFFGGSAHAKVAVADDNMCFITSANLTGFAMEKNMEAGVLLRGGDIPRRLAAHLVALADTKIIAAV